MIYARAIHAELIKFKLPPKTFARLLQARGLSDLEYRLNFAVIEHVQVCALREAHVGISFRIKLYLSNSTYRYEFDSFL